MSKTKFGQSLSGSARASVILAYKHLLEIKAQVPARMERHLSFLLKGPQPRGRPKGKLQYDDDPYLIEMGRLLETEEAGKVHRAAKIVVQGGQVPGQSDDANIRRLSTAFKKDEALYRFLGREADPIS